jgi:hypothetical protein
MIYDCVWVPATLSYVKAKEMLSYHVFHLDMRIVRAACSQTFFRTTLDYMCNIYINNTCHLHKFCPDIVNLTSSNQWWQVFAWKDRVFYVFFKNTAYTDSSTLQEKNTTWRHRVMKFILFFKILNQVVGVFFNLCCLAERFSSFVSRLSEETKTQLSNKQLYSLIFQAFRIIIYWNH